MREPIRGAQGSPASAEPQTPNAKRQTPTKWVVLLLLTALMWSVGGVLIKSVEWNPLAIAGARSLIAVLVIGLLRPSIVKQLSWGAFFGGLAYAGTVILFVTATKLTTAASAIFLQYTAPIYIALLSPWVLKEQVRWSDWVLICIALGGIALFFCDRLSFTGTWGVIAALGSGVSFALLTILMRRLKHASPEAAVLAGNIIAVLIALPAMLPATNLGRNWPWLVALGVVQLAIPYLLYSQAIRHIRALDASLISMIEPILNPIWVMLAIGERPAAWSVVGGCIILGTSALRGLASRKADS